MHEPIMHACILFKLKQSWNNHQTFDFVTLELKMSRVTMRNCQFSSSSAWGLIFFIYTSRFSPQNQSALPRTVIFVGYI